MSWIKLYDANGIDRYSNLRYAELIETASQNGIDWYVTVDGVRTDGTFTSQADAETVAGRLVASQGGVVNAADLL